MKYLYPYECEKKNLSTPAELQAAIDGNRREGRRSSYGQFDQQMQGQLQMVSFLYTTIIDESKCLTREFQILIATITQWSSADVTFIISYTRKCTKFTSSNDGRTTARPNDKCSATRYRTAYDRIHKNVSDAQGTKT